MSVLCSVLEAVLLSITPSYLEQVIQRRPKSGKAIHSVKNRLDESLSSILILNTFAHTMGAAGVGAQALRVFGPASETLIAVLLTLAILYFSEIIPKTLGATYWRQLAVPSVFMIASARAGEKFGWIKPPAIFPPEKETTGASEKT